MPILEMAKAIRFQAALSLEYRVHSILIGTHIINRLLTLVLQYKTPYELSVKRPP